MGYSEMQYRDATGSDSAWVTTTDHYLRPNRAVCTIWMRETGWRSRDGHAYGSFVYRGRQSAPS